MNEELRAQIERELPQRGWSTGSHAKLLDFLTKYAKESADRPVARPIALFDGDNTTWTGDIGDTTFVFLLRNLGLSPRLHELLPASIAVPPGSFGVADGGALFAAARVRGALDTMWSAYREAIAPDAGMREFL